MKLDQQALAPLATGATIPPSLMAANPHRQFLNFPDHMSTQPMWKSFLVSGIFYLPHNYFSSTYEQTSSSNLSSTQGTIMYSDKGGVGIPHPRP